MRETRVGAHRIPIVVTLESSDNEFVHPSGRSGAGPPEPTANAAVNQIALSRAFTCYGALTIGFRLVGFDPLFMVVLAGMAVAGGLRNRDGRPRESRPDANAGRPPKPGRCGSGSDLSSRDRDRHDRGRRDGRRVPGLNTSDRHGNRRDFPQGTGGSAGGHPPAGLAGHSPADWHPRNVGADRRGADRLNVLPDRRLTFSGCGRAHGGQHRQDFRGGSSGKPRTLVTTKRDSVSSERHQDKGPTLACRQGPIRIPSPDPLRIGRQGSSASCQMARSGGHPHWADWSRAGAPDRSAPGRRRR